MRRLDWDDDDPAVRLGREGLSLTPIEEPAEPRIAVPEPSEQPLTAEERRGRVATFLARVRAGDTAAAEALRRLLLDK
jgi:hypothetical protein